MGEFERVVERFASCQGRITDGRREQSGMLFEEPWHRGVSDLIGPGHLAQENSQERVGARMTEPRQLEYDRWSAAAKE